MTEAQRRERHEAGVSFERWLRFKSWMNALVATPVLIGMCTFLPPLGVTAVAGGSCLGFTVGTTMDTILSYKGYLLGVRRWDIANGFEAFPVL